MSTLVANRDLLIRAAVALGPITSQAMFVGGSVVGILALDATTPARPTDDVDIAIEVATTIEYQTRISESLRSLGFEIDTRPRAPLCRWLKAGLVVDVMPLDMEKFLGFEMSGIELRSLHASSIGLRTSYRFPSSLHRFLSRPSSKRFSIAEKATTWQVFVDALPGHLGYADASPERLSRLTSSLAELSKLR